MLITYLRQILGEVPSAGTNYNYAILEYVIAGVVLLWSLALGYRLIMAIFGVSKK